MMIPLYAVLSVLLVLYILATVLCLRSVRHKRGLYAVAGSKEGGQHGQLYTEYRGLPQAESQHQLAPSDTGSRDTEQESLTVRFIWQMANHIFLDES